MASPLAPAHSQAVDMVSVPSHPTTPPGQSALGPAGTGGSPPPVNPAQAFPISHGQHININNNNILACKMQAVKTSTYSSPPPMPSNPENNVCKLIEYRGAKVAAFVVDGMELICLPQAFELFLKHLVGGLHTVYTKLKRLDILPVVCNVEQVRILRGLGAIQPGVNRCKLLSCKDFDVLYEDCTNSSARPGRPPKRSPSIHASHDTLDKLKKSRLENGDHYSFDPRIYGGDLSYLFPGDRKASALLNGFPHSPYALSALPFMPFGHPMMSPPTSMGMAAAAHLGLRPDGSVIKDRASSDSDLISPRLREDKIEPGVRCLDKSAMMEAEKDALRGLDYHTDPKPLNLNINGHLQDLSTKHKSGLRRCDDDDSDDDRDSDDDKDDDLDSLQMSENARVAEANEKLSQHSQAFGTQLVNGDAQGLSSIETLLLNIQGLLKVAAENARHHERQFSLDKAELKMEVLREREVRETLEKQLLDEQKNRVMLQKRLKKEKKARKRLLDQLDSEQKRSAQLDDSPKSSPSDPLRLSNDSISQELGLERPRSASDRKISEPERSHLYDSYLSPNINSTATRFPYLPMVKNDA